MTSTLPSIPPSRRLWWVTLAAVVVAGTTFSLGQWQLRRAAQKEAAQAAIEAKSRMPVLDNRTLGSVGDVEQLVHRQAQLKGSWVAGRTVFLDNRPMSGRSGFFVVTPLVLEGTGQTILVQRGWAARDFANRTHLPPVTTPVGPVTVQGRIAPPPYKLYEFKGADDGRIRQNLDLAAFRAETGLPLMDVSLLQTGAPGDGLLREWAAPNFGLEKHYGYAFQWFGLCLLVLVLYAWFQLVPRLRSRFKNQNRDQLL